jgi:hypothetical protein
MKKVSVVVTTYQDRNFLDRFLQSLRRSDGSDNFEIIVVDDDPSEPPVPDVIFVNPVNADVSDEPAPLIDSTEKVTWIRPSEAKFRYGPWMAREVGVRKSTGDFVVTCDSDTVVPKHWWTAFKRIFDSDPKIGAVGPRIWPAWNQWVQFLDEEDPEVKKLTPDSLDSFDMSKYEPEWFDINHLPDVHHVTKQHWKLEEVIQWDALSDVFICCTRNILDDLRRDEPKLEGIPDGLGISKPDRARRSIFKTFGMRAVVSDRVVVWCGRESPFITTIPWRNPKDKWIYNRQERR